MASLPEYIRIGKGSDIHDTRYALLLKHTPFFQYVIQHDSVHLHPDARLMTFVLKGLSKEYIYDLYKRLFERKHVGEVEQFLLQRAEEDGFISIRSDFGQDYVFVNDNKRYETWASTSNKLSRSWDIFSAIL